MEKMRPRFTDYQKKKFILDYYASTYTKSAFCRLNGLKKSTLDYWLYNCDYLKRGIDPEKLQKVTRIDSVPAENAEPEALVRIGDDCSSDDNSLIEIPSSVISPSESIPLQKKQVAHNIDQIGVPIKITVGEICIELEYGCSSLDLKNVMTALKGELR